LKKEQAMESQERVYRAIEMTGPDRPPITHATLPGAVKRYGLALAQLHARFPSDVLSAGSATEGEFGPEIGVPSRDTWGSLWVRHSDEHKGQVVGFPLADWSDLEHLDVPDTASDKLMADMEARIAANAGALYTQADGDIIWQRMFYLRGYAAVLQDLLLERARCVRLRGLDSIHFRDDWGTQEALMISPSLWREFFKPSYAKLFAMTREAGKHVWFHSDGAIASIIPDLVEIGVQVLNPQTDLIGRERLTALCGDTLCIQGDIDRQWVLPYGSPDDARAAVQADIDAFGRRNGGYIGRAESAGDVPLENLTAVYEELVTYRVEPKIESRRT
jgi:uroporphyrinogen decarboxylase